MKVQFIGAAREVTGSCYLIETNRSKILIDCGMHQGSVFADAKNFKDFPFVAKDITAVISTHAHLDHVGRLPKLSKLGFTGPIYATEPTARLASLVLEDAEAIMEDDFKRSYRPKLYDREDVERVSKLFKAVEYNKAMKIGDLSIRFRDAGHILGSSFIEIEEAGGARITFSGDLGNIKDPILRPTDALSETDAVVIESTYGNRLHEELGQRSAKLQQSIIDSVKRNGVLIIPAFAIERTQELLFELNHLVENKLIPQVDIYLDSPLGIKTSEVVKDYPQYYNADALGLVRHGDDLFDFPGLHKTLTRDDSKGINEAKRPKIIIAGSGMMNGGRILHHLVRYLGDARTTVLIIGYQASGTLGRKLYSGDRRVEVMGERIEVKAKIVSIGAYSAHADQAGLVHWIETAKKLPSHIYCTHGEEDACEALATKFQSHFKLGADVPRQDDVITL